MSATWNPTSPDEIESKKAFEDLSHSVDKVVLPPSDPSQSNRFILRSKGYFDLQAYVLSGKDFPREDSDFEAKIPASAFKKLSVFDTGIYTTTKATMVAVGSTCYEYHQNHLAKLVTAGQTAIQYSENTVDLLETADGLNLRHNLDIILDEKYTSESKFDQAYRDAKDGALYVLEMLRNDAREKKETTDEITRTLIRFKEDTLINQPKVKFLIQQYKTGPVENQSEDKKTPYLVYLNKDLADSLENFNNMVKNATSKHTDWVTNTAIAIGSSFFGPIGKIFMSAFAFQASRLRGTYEDLEHQIDKLKKDRQEETELITSVNKLLFQCTDIDRKMDDAIIAMTELSQLFSNQSNCYDKIATFIGNMKAAPDRGSLATRKACINHSTKVCIDKLKELKDVAEEFTKSIHTQVEL